ncbi:hypothetical protein C6558_23705 [Ensifer sp. NM-2]|uniref:hypothetical protein n=1 Tax=Ensifer sp. NM-2 TaxID=2109730 RepID=UPI000D11BF89|nr:hypothetical protein [Ensifer sp. NM-2]PSS62177.1 hypothetical protein C6558_23705 [Ensifer sp. NM-2]
MADEAIWTTKEIVATVLGTGVLSGLTSVVVEFFRGLFRRKRSRTYLCMRIATALESYAISCAELLEAADAHYGQTQTPLIISLPDAPVYPDDLDWHAINPEIAYLVMSFLNEREAQAASARHADHFEGDLFGGHEAVKTTGKRAYELATVLRGIANLQAPDFDNVLKPLF